MSAAVVESKQALRRAMSARRRSVGSAQAVRAGHAAAQTAMAQPAVRAAARVGLYAALADELPSRPLFDAVVRRGASALLPRVLPDRALEFAEVVSWEELRPGAYGVLEPPAHAPVSELGSGDVVVVPGVAFDAGGHRLGRGKGYYDRTFPKGAGAAPILIGFAYEFQVVDAVPHDAADRAVDAIVTEQCVRHCAGDAT